MKVAVFSSKPYDEISLQNQHGHSHQFSFFESRLDKQTAPLAIGFEAVCAFVNDVIDAEVLSVLSSFHVKLLVMRCSGFNNVDLDAAKKFDITVARVPEYSPYSVAEHTVGLILTLNRRLNHSYNRIRERNFALQGLLGFDLHKKSVGIIGTGRIGSQTAKILLGFGCCVFAYDMSPNKDLEKLGVVYCELAQLLKSSDIVALHCPLLESTRHIINAASLRNMKPGAMLINTSRGGLLDTSAVLDALKSGQLGYLGIDVYEKEAELFFEDRSGAILQDDVFARLLTFPNVVVTGHQAFFTREALLNIAEITVKNITDFEEKGMIIPKNLVV